MCADRQLPSIKHKLVLLGDQSVGKTSIINRFMYDYFDSTQYQTTVGIDFFSKNITVEEKGGRRLSSTSSGSGNEAAATASAARPYTVKLHIWDTAGQERYRSLIPSYVRDSAAAIVVYDIGNRESFLSAFTWVDEIKQALGLSSSPSGLVGEEKPASSEAAVASPGIVVMLVGNKLDVSADGGREVSTEEAERRAQENGFLFCEVSAKDGSNVKRLFRSVAQALPAPPASAFAADTTREGPSSGGHGAFGAPTRSPFLVTPSVMAEAESRGQQQQQHPPGSGGGATAGGGAAGDGGGGCC